MKIRYVRGMIPYIDIHTDRTMTTFLICHRVACFHC